VIRPPRRSIAGASASLNPGVADYDAGVISGKRSSYETSRAGAEDEGRIYEIDDLDKGVIGILKSDGRASNVEIARSLGVTEATIRKRIANLLSHGLIEIVAVPTPKLAGFTLSAIMGLNVSLDKLRAVSAALVKFPEVRYCGMSTGRFDIMIEAFFSNHEHLLTFSTDSVGQIDGVLKVETSLILDISKFSYEWEIELP
jgi:Lrp/AsnC family transcriptional regulator for asnA, asnC and gidA